jgi:hypothetical protein
MTERAKSADEYLWQEQHTAQAPFHLRDFFFFFLFSP